MGWSDEILDAVNECLAEFSAHIIAPVGTVGVNPQTYPVCFDYRGVKTAIDALAAGVQPSASVSFTIRRADFLAAGLHEESFLARSTAPGDVLIVTEIEDDEARPFVRVTAEEKR